MLPNRNIIRNAACEAVSEIVRQQVRGDVRLISSGMIDSLSILRLISLIEKKLNVTIPTDTLQPEDFDDLDLIVQTVERVAQAGS